MFLFQERENIPVLMLTNYNQQFSNSYYHSIYDNAVVNNYNYSLGEQQAVVQHLSSLGAAVASAVVFLATADEIVVEKDDKVRIFSQFKQMKRRLKGDDSSKKLGGHPQ